MRVELRVGHLESYLVGVFGSHGTDTVVLEGEPEQLRALFAEGMDQVALGGVREPAT